jgi:hypothetical protein
MLLATRDAWGTLPLPEKRQSLDFSASYSLAATTRIKQGLVPEEMEDKWFVFFEQGWLYFYHSWTKACIYAICIEEHSAGCRVIDSWVNAQSDQYRLRDLEYERQLLAYLIDALLLGKPAISPVPTGTPDAELHQFSTVGRVDGRDQPSPRRSPWSWFKRWLFAQGPDNR